LAAEGAPVACPALTIRRTDKYSINQLVDFRGCGVYSLVWKQSNVRRRQMHMILVWAHVSLTMLAFGASPLGRVGLRYLLSGVTEQESAKAILRGFPAIFLAGGISVTAGVAAGLILAWHDGFAQRWIIESIILITIAGVGGVAIEDRWVKRLRCAEGDSFAVILHEKTPFLAAVISPAIWLYILLLMIERPV
jgi:hypothetical protein